MHLSLRDWYNEKLPLNGFNEYSLKNIDLWNLLGKTGDAFRGFDQAGFALTEIEKLYHRENVLMNEQEHGPNLSRKLYGLSPYLLKTWPTGHSVISNQMLSYVNEPSSPVQINHIGEFHRPGYAGDALDQIKSFASHNQAYNRLIHMQPKWGFDISIEYCDSEKCFELFHFEWDTFNRDDFESKRREICDFVIKNFSNEENSIELANEIWSRRSEWIDLDYIQQSKWRTDFLGLPPEQFKQVVWNKINT